MAAKPYDIFITHAWRYHDDWTRLCELLDQSPGVSWRNFSVPWFDPVMDPNTENGARMVRRWLESQIVPVSVVVFLGGVYAVKSARKWLDLEVEMALRNNKPIVGMPAFGETELPGDIHPMISATASWDTQTLVTTLDRVLAGR